MSTSIDCGSQVFLCDLPIRFDTYRGCSHACSYCFANRKKHVDDIVGLYAIQSLKNFVAGNRIAQTKWCDWDIPLHWGGMSDPFQPKELELGISLRALDVFAETKYPVVVSTKGRLVADPRYLDLIGAGNFVVQVSMFSPILDSKEQGAPPFLERLKYLPKIRAKCKRLIVRCQPYVPGQVKEVTTKWLPAYRDAGVYGVVFEGFKSNVSFPGSVRVAGDNCFSLGLLKPDFSLLREVCHRLGLRFFSGENRLRSMGDSPTCCGIENLEGFVPNTANLNHIFNDTIVYRSKMSKVGTAYCFKSLRQTQLISLSLQGMTFRDVMELVRGSKYREFIG